MKRHSSNPPSRCGIYEDTFDPAPIPDLPGWRRFPFPHPWPDFFYKAPK